MYMYYAGTTTILYFIHTYILSYIHVHVYAGTYTCITGNGRYDNIVVDYNENQYCRSTGTYTRQTQSCLHLEVYLILFGSNHTGAVIY